MLLVIAASITITSSIALVSRDNSSIGVGNKLGVKVLSTSIAIAASITITSSIALVSRGSKVVSPGCSNCRFIHWDHSTIGVSHQATIQASSTGQGETGGKNKALHCCV